MVFIEIESLFFVQKMRNADQWHARCYFNSLVILAPLTSSDVNKDLTTFKAKDQDKDHDTQGQGQGQGPDLQGPGQ